MSEDTFDYIPETPPPALPRTPPPALPDHPPPEKPPRVASAPDPPAAASLRPATLPRSRPRASPALQATVSAEVPLSFAPQGSSAAAAEGISSAPSGGQSSLAPEAQPSTSPGAQLSIPQEAPPSTPPDDQPSTPPEDQSSTPPQGQLSTSADAQTSTSSVQPDVEAQSSTSSEPPHSTQPDQPSDEKVSTSSEGAPSEALNPVLTLAPPADENGEGDSDVFLDAMDPSAVLLRRKEPGSYAETTLQRVSSRIDRLGSSISRFLERGKTPGGDRERPKSVDVYLPIRRSNEKNSEPAEPKNSIIPFGSNFLRRSFRQKTAEDEWEATRAAAPPSPAVSVRSSVYNEDLVAALVCAACARYMVAPIEQCKRGHNICKFCRRRAHQHRCPKCSARLTGIRNAVAEEMARKLLFPCVHAHAGCTRQVPNDELEFHEPRCPFRVYSCLINVASGVPCKWEGRRVGLEEHVRSEHPRYYSDQETTKWRWSPNLVVQMEDYQLLCVLGEVFWYCAVQDPERMRVCWFVQHVGYDQESVRYEFLFSMGDAHGRRLSFNCTTLPDYSSVGSIVESGHCVDMSYQQALSFVDGDGTITFSVSVRKCEA